MKLVKNIKHNIYEIIKDYERILNYILIIKRTFYRFFLKRFHHSIINSYLKSNSLKKLQLGCGPNAIEGWLNTDLNPVPAKSILYLDVTRGMIFPDNTFDYVFHEHIIEHLTHSDGVRFIQECWRVLKPGGTLRVATPDLKFIIDFYNHEKSELQMRYLHWIVDTFMADINNYMDTFVINNLFYNYGHKLIYDNKLLQEILEKSGFINIKEYNVGESNDINLMNVEQHGILIGSEEFNELETLVMEGTKPS